MDIKTFIAVISLTISASTTFAQKSYLEAEKHTACELFAQKSGYDWRHRLSQIDSLEGREVTVFEVKGKDNLIKASYTGRIMIIRKKSGKTRDKGDATVITVVEDMGGGKRQAHFPLTNDRYYRIYLKSCMESGLSGNQG